MSGRRRGRRGQCGRCGGQKRRNAAAVSQPVADCSACGRAVCQRHVTWDSARGRWICTKCERDGADGDAVPDDAERR